MRFIVSLRSVQVVGTQVHSAIRRVHGVSNSHHRSWFVPRMPATTTTEARVQEDRDATLHVDGSLGAEGAFAFPAPHQNTCRFNRGHMAVAFKCGCWTSVLLTR